MPLPVEFTIDSENKENVPDLEPSKAWIKNIGSGSCKKYKIKPRIETKVKPLAQLDTPSKTHVQSVSTPDRIKPSVPVHKQFIDEKELLLPIKIKQENSSETWQTTQNSPMNGRTEHHTMYPTCAELYKLSMDETLDSTLTSVDQNETVIEVTNKMRTPIVDRFEMSSLREFLDESKNPTIANDSIFYPIQSNAFDITIKPNGMSSLDGTPPSKGFDRTNSTLLNSTEISNTLTQIDEAANFLRNVRISDLTSRANKHNIFHDQSLSPSYKQFKKVKSHDSLSTHVRNQVPPSPGVPEAEFIHQVFMNEDDFNMFAQTGQIFFVRGNPYFQRKIS